MTEKTYPLFCPVAMASDLLEPRWTLLILCEMSSGSKRFNEIQRGVPGMSPGLLSKRLKTMEASGLLRREASRRGAHSEYRLTPIAEELLPIVMALGQWAHRNVDSTVSLRHLDARLLMWKIRQKVNRAALPLDDCVIQFTLRNAPHPDSHYWLVIKPGIEPDLCFTDLGFDIDLFVHCELRALTAAWMGHSCFDAELEAGGIRLIGHVGMARTFTRWLMRSSFAGDDVSQHREAAE
jgi:DNA-binding HxlR family transcriptional regulator